MYIRYKNFNFPGQLPPRCRYKHLTLLSNNQTKSRNESEEETDNIYTRLSIVGGGGGWQEIVDDDRVAVRRVSRAMHAAVFVFIVYVLCFMNSPIARPKFVLNLKN